MQQVETAEFFPASVAGTLTGELVCDGRSVANGEWDKMRAGTIGDNLNPWGIALFQTLRTVGPKSASEQSACDKWLEQTSTREEARLDRIHGAVGVIPTGVGGLKPVAMNRSLHLVDQLLPKLDQRVRIPCNAAGIATRA